LFAEPFEPPDRFFKRQRKGYLIEPVLGHARPPICTNRPAVRCLSASRNDCIAFEMNGFEFAGSQTHVQIAGDQIAKKSVFCGPLAEATQQPFKVRQAKRLPLLC
jgi:hypothetical protein